MIDRLVPPQRELGIFRPQPLLRLAGIALGVVLLAWAFLVPGDDASDEAHPATEVERAYAAWTATPPDREDALGTLRVHALGQPPDRVARGLVAARENGWDTAFVDQFTAIVAWAVSVRASAPDTVHAQAERALASADAVTVEVGEALLAVAAQKGHLAARLTAAQRRLDAGDAEAGRLGLITLAAANDFAPAQAELARRYEAGDGLPRDLQRALYWYLRAAEGGAEVAARLGALQLALPVEDRAEAKRWLAADTSPVD